MYTIETRGPEWERRNDRDVFRHYFNTEREANSTLAAEGVFVGY